MRTQAYLLTLCCSACIVPAYAWASITATAIPVLTFEGSSFSGTVARFASTDSNQAPANYSANIDWGDGTTGLPMSIIGPGGLEPEFEVVAAHTYTEAGSYTLTITIEDTSDDSSGVASATSIIQDAPLQASGTYFLSEPGTPFSDEIATFSDGNPFAVASDFTATIIDWGDGTAGTGTVFSDGSGGFGVLGSHTYAHKGVETVIILITDIGGSNAVATSYTGDRIFADGFD